MLSIMNPITTPLTPEQLKHYEETGYLLIKKGCSDDLIDAFNRHIYEIRSGKPEDMPLRRSGLRPGEGRITIGKSSHA